MLPERSAVALLFFPLIVWIIADGSWLYAAGITGILTMAAYEYGSLFCAGGYRPAKPLLIIGVIAIVLARVNFGFEYDHFLLAGIGLIVMTWHVIDFERGAPKSGIDFALTLSGILYVGWIGAFFITIRRMPDGLWWFLLSLLSIWIADSAALLFGRRFGRHKLAHRVSPKKTWEGYLAGIGIGILGGAGLALLWRIGAGSLAGINAMSGAIIGGVVGTVAPMGDLGISMFKRQFGEKDTGALLPGHGGVLDRIDTWLWSAVIGYFLVMILTSTG
jgi:phosphatidate cytidylyltransferase